MKGHFHEKLIFLPLTDLIILILKLYQNSSSVKVSFSSKNLLLGAFFQVPLCISHAEER